MESFNDISRGSIWRKWDLQVQPIKNCWFTNLEKNKSNIYTATEQYIDNAIKNNIKVIAITDHNTGIAIDKAIEYSQDKEIIVLPGVELDANSGEHILIIFNPQYQEKIKKSTWNDVVESFLQTKCKIESPFHENDVAKKIGITTENLIELINKENIGIFIFAHCTSNDGFLQRCGDGDKRKNIISSFFEKNENFIFEIKEPEKQEEVRTKIKNWMFNDELIPIISSSDANQASDVGKHFTWIKADPTFEGLKQILYEPKERIRIQNNNPELKFEKSPFTEITIQNKINVFNDDEDNVSFRPCTIPLNNNLVSIIGGRGMGKSVLINYIAAGLGKNKEISKYVLSPNFIVKRKKSLQESDLPYSFQETHHIPFMYISQSQIKDLVSDPKKFTNNIIETIGVKEDYKIEDKLQENISFVFGEYYRLRKFLNENGTTSIEKKEEIDSEIKKNHDLIKNITSEANRLKLESYQENVKRCYYAKKEISYYENFIKRLDSIKEELNNEILKISESKYKLPSIDFSIQIDVINSQILPEEISKYNKLNEEIEATKKSFPDYTGDLGTLLNNVSSYQDKIVRLTEQKKFIEDKEHDLKKLKNESFKEIGLQIKESIYKYKEKINAQWLEFRTGKEDLHEEQKKLLGEILSKDDLNVQTQIKFDIDEMYKRLLNKLDGRSYNKNKLEHTLKIKDLDDFFNFICFNNSKGIFETPIEIQKIGDVFYREYTSFITHEVLVTSHNRPIRKLSHGQQGTIYLRLQLAANMFSETIIYDQPEDDLDNNFIMTELVEIFRKIKHYRQVIIVSHNANLVVNSDSEQIIIASNIDGELTYESGSLENPKINDQICKILEGGVFAFQKREKKYNFQFYNR